MNPHKDGEIRILKTILWVYIILAIVIAGLNYGYANQSDSSIAELITWFWHFYENWIKTLFIIIGSFLTLSIIGSSQRSTMRKGNFTAIISGVFYLSQPISNMGSCGNICRSYLSCMCQYDCHYGYIVFWQAMAMFNLVSV